MPQFSGNPPVTAEQLPLHKNPAADAGTQGDHQHIPQTRGPADEALAQQGRIGVVERPGGNLKGFFHEGFQAGPFIARNFPIGSDDGAGAGFHLAAGRNRDTLQGLRMLPAETGGFQKYGFGNGGSITVKGYAGGAFFSNLSPAVHPSQFDFGAADIYRQNH